MKKIIFGLAFALLVSLFAASSVQASGYPSDYAHQRAFFTVDGPVVFGFVSSGIMSPEFVIGYKKNGVLGQFSDINVLIRVFNKGCNGHALEYRHVIQREWHGTGLLSTSIPVYYLSPYYHRGAVPERIELSFYKNDMWDSKHSQNYVFNMQDFYSKQSFPVYTFTGTEYQNSISLSVWNFIVDLMR